MCDGCEHPVEHLIVDAAHEAVERRMARRPLQPERGPQIRVPRQPLLCLPKRLVLEAHQAEDSYQLRLREGVLGVLDAVGSQDFPHHFDRSPGKEH